MQQRDGGLGELTDSSSSVALLNNAVSCLEPPFLCLGKYFFKLHTSVTWSQSNRFNPSFQAFFVFNQDGLLPKSFGWIRHHPSGKQTIKRKGRSRLGKASVYRHQSRSIRFFLMLPTVGAFLLVRGATLDSARWATVFNYTLTKSQLEMRQTFSHQIKVFSTLLCSANVKIPFGLTQQKASAKLLLLKQSPLSLWHNWTDDWFLSTEPGWKCFRLKNFKMDDTKYQRSSTAAGIVKFGLIYDFPIGKSLTYRP